MGRTFRVLASALACLWLLGVTSIPVAGLGPTEAPAGFDNLTNGLVAQPQYDTDRTTFEERDDISRGLGPVYNAQSCAECHQTPITGGGSQIAELRAGTFADGVFTPHPGGSLINDRATDASIQEHAYDSDAFAEFMRAPKAPPRGPRNATVNAGEVDFNAIGCNVCHTAAMTTAPAGTSINGGALNVGNALGDKIIHPFSDYMLHDIGTGDGIVQNGGPSTRNKLRTAPLWGLRTRSRLMHDGKALT